MPPYPSAGDWYETDVPATSDTPAAVVRFLAGAAAEHAGLSAEGVEGVVAAVMARERIGTTGIGHGIAVPHAATDLVKAACVVLGWLAAPVDWRAIDGEPVRVVCLALRPNNKTGLARLENIVRVLRERFATPG